MKLLKSKYFILPNPELNNYRESNINLLWMVLISEKERNEIMENGSDEIIEKLNKIGENVFSLRCEEVL